ncbi:GntR family transcriptional regulator [Jiangella alkaliphila]|uniref:DNA-binding transcriptional regulator, GntR family n=1 Tax=Jiangella alkaliphila TaxID=419479 RepID=A0A1H2LW21_9ACTN|nr:GntR family transcriptional regulator [Jiangella alkaliphila]SDU84915.1 DNA-binding transcriptional regulator, GntR family [Jiangella alkaliphila]
MTIGPDHAARLVPERRALADDVYDVILGLLMDHRIEPGAKVSIDGIARDFDVSPTPVREALARLESEGLVVKRPLRGYTAAPLLDAEGLRKLFEMRRILEPAAAQLAAGRMTPATVAALQELADDMRASASSAQDEGTRYQDYRDFADQDAQFHRIIAEHSGNDLLADAIVRLRSHMHLYRLYFKHGIEQDTSGEHEAVLDALRGRDAAAAAAAMLDHIEHSYARMAPHVED